MLQHPRFKPHFHVEIVANEAAFVVSEFSQTVLQGRLYELVIPRLDGRSVDEVCEQLWGQASPAQVYYTLQKLEQKGFLCESDESLPVAEASLWTAQGIDPAAVVRRLAETSVVVDAMGLDVGPFRSLLQSLHVQLNAEGKLRVVVTDNYLRKELQSCNQEALRSGQPWLLLKPTGNLIWIGPLFVPGKTGCWECLVQRLRANNPVVGYLDGVGREQAGCAMGHSWTPATLSVAWGLAAHAVTGWIARGGELPLLEGRIQTLDLLAWKSDSHVLVQLPSCPACGSGPTPLDRTIRPLVLESRKKTYVEDGGHRSHSPQETLDKYGHHVSFICGAVNTLERFCPSNGGVMNVFSSGSNVAHAPRNMASLRVGLRNSTAGKGINELQAKASALCEGLERYCGIFRGDEPRRPARMVDLGEAAIHPNDCMRFSEKQYRDRDIHNATGSLFNYIPLPFDPEYEVEWTALWSLSEETVRYLPTAQCYYCYPYLPESDFCVGCSNGAAAGNCLEEAILQGFLELVERDSVSLWWYNRIRMPAVDFDSFEEPYLGRLGKFLETRQRSLWALDLTSDLGIPAYAALSARMEGDPDHIMFGFGAHLDPRIALLRAVTELNQMLVHLMHGPVEEVPAYLTDVDTVHWLRTAKLSDHPYLVPREGAPVGFSAYPHSWTNDLKEDILICKSRVEELGLKMLVLDQTRPEIGMSVAKVVVPGLRHFWARFAPGRLYDVPVKLGWVPKPLTEEQLNPVPMFI